MSRPIISIVVPTHNRPHLLPRAVASALAQTVADLEVIVVDDGSDPPVTPDGSDRLRVIRLPKSRGGAAARNAGLEAARGRWVTYLDDDDELLPHMAEVSLDGLGRSVLPRPVAAISGVEVVGAAGRVVETRLPPTRPQGRHFSLEPLEAGLSYHTKQTFVVAPEVLRAVGGWDESFRSRVHTELFLRLNPACSLLGLPAVTYRLYAHAGLRVSHDPSLRRESCERLLLKHRACFEAHREAYADFLLAHARRLREMGERRAALASVARAARLAPRRLLTRAGARVWGRSREASAGDGP